MGEIIIGSEAVAAGTVTRGQLRWNYESIYPDVYVPNGTAPTTATKARAAWLWSGRRGVVTGRAAAALHGAKWIADNAPVELVWSNNHSPRGIITRRDRIGASEITWVRGIPVATPARAALDLGRNLPRDKAVAHLDSLARATRITADDVLMLTDRYAGSKGVRRCREALALMDRGAESPKETWVRLVLIDGGYPRPQTQIPLYEHGVLAAELDMGWKPIRLSVEYDGTHHQTDRKTYAKGVRRADLIDRLDWRRVVVIKEDREVDVLAHVRDAWLRREREGMAVNF